jgi:FkbM family methyltransferase
MSGGVLRERRRAGSRGLSRWLYYASSIPTILLRMRRRRDILRLLLGLPVRRPLEVRLDSGARFRVSKRMDVWILKESCLDLVYERGANVEDGWTVVDVGAGLGDFAIHVARRRPRATVYAFEPLPESFARLEENIRLNGLTNVRAVPEAIAGSEGAVSLYTVTGLSGQHRTAGSGAATATVAPISVAATTLSRAFERLGIARCDFLKIDCEGAEYEILLGLPAETLARIARIALEYHDNVTPHTHDELVRFLQARGFTVRARPSPAWHELGFLYAANPALADSQRTR